MKIWKIAFLVCTLTLSSSINAALLSRDLDGNLSTIEAYYDDTTNLTWLADANLAMTSNYAPDGLMTWMESQRWVYQLNQDRYGNTSGWRLPFTPKSDRDCFDPALLASCLQGEMAQLFYNSADNTIPTSTTAELFSNIQTGTYWSSDVYSQTSTKPPINGISQGTSTAFILTFDFNNGGIRTTDENQMQYAWAIHDGDIGVAAVPVPASFWLLGSGLIALSGISKRKKT